MATQLFFRRPAEIATCDRCSLATNAANLAGVGVGWVEPYPLRTTRGGSLSSAGASTVTGTTLGIEVGPALQWISPPIDQDVTISGAITKNLWMSESNMSANVGAQVVIERIDSQGVIVSTIANHERGVELAVGPTRLVNNWATGTVTSTDMLKGDRIRIRVAGNDGGGTMATGFSFDFGFAGTTAAADGDSYVTFTETFGFLTSDPTTTPIYLTNTNSDVDPGGAGTDTKEAWTARGAGVQNPLTSASIGWRAPIQATASAGGNTLEWFTRPLTAFTLAAPVLTNVRFGAGASNVALRVEIAVAANDGTSPVVWAATSYPLANPGTETVYNMYLAGDDQAVTDGQRLRLRIYFDDSSTTAMGGSSSMQPFYAGTSGGASGDTFLTFGQTLTEFVAAVSLPFLVTAPYRPA